MFAHSAIPLPSTSLGDFDPTPDLEAHLFALAMRAKVDRAARDALYDALAFKIDRFVRRYRYRLNQFVICDLDDVAQEAFIVFCDLVESWPGQQSFLGYFFSRFPWRLARAVDIIERGRSVTRLVSFDEVGEVLAPPDSDDLFILEEIGAGLSPRDRALLELHIGYRMHLSEVGRVLGGHPRGIYRAWDRIVDDLRATWRGEPAPDGAAPPTKTRKRPGRRPRHQRD